MEPHPDMTPAQLASLAETQIAIKDISGECMNRVYDMLRECSNEHLNRMWQAADPFLDAGALLRHQIAYVLHKRSEGKWFPKENPESP